MNIYPKGDVNLLKQSNLVSVAGTREISKKSSEWLKEAFKKLPKDTVIVSGLALGTDTIAHKLALEFGFKTIAVLPTGINRITPRKNIPLAEEILKDGGLLLSEYSPNTGLEYNGQDIERNKIIAKLGKYLIMPQCNKQSGTMSTVNFFRKQKKVIVIQDDNYSGNEYILKDDRYLSIIF